MAAGDVAQPFNLWGNVTDDDIDQRYENNSGSDTKNDFDIQNYVLGGDSPARLLRGLGDLGRRLAKIEARLAAQAADEEAEE